MTDSFVQLTAKVYCLSPNGHFNERDHKLNTIGFCLDLLLPRHIILFQAFASHYTELNPDQVNKFQSPDTIFLLAFAIIMLNTDLHNKSIKQDRRMKPNDFIKNLRGMYVKIVRKYKNEEKKNI